MSAIKAEMKVRVTLKKLLELAKERDLVREILQAKNVKKVWLEKKEEIRPELLQFEQSMAVYLEKGDRFKPFTHLPEFVDEENILEFCVVLMMTGAINEADVVREWSDVVRLLKKVSEEGKEFRAFAERLKEVLSSDYFTDYTEEELLKIIL